MLMELLQTLKMGLKGYLGLIGIKYDMFLCMLAHLPLKIDFRNSSDCRDDLLRHPVLLRIDQFKMVNLADVQNLMVLTSE